jgi:hypothetical protein
MTLWSIFRSPLIMGGNLTAMDAATAALLTNDEVLAVNQHATGGHAVVNDDKKAVWVAKGDRAIYVALFNLADTPQTVEYPLQPLGLGTSAAVRDLWARKNLGKLDVLKATLPPHASGLYQIR